MGLALRCVVVAEKEFLKGITFRTVVLDEAHRIKGGDTLVSQAMHHVKGVFKLLLTGTPLQVCPADPHGIAVRVLGAPGDVKRRAAGSTQCSGGITILAIPTAPKRHVASELAQRSVGARAVGAVGATAGDVVPRGGSGGGGSSSNGRSAVAVCRQQSRQRNWSGL